VVVVSGAVWGALASWVGGLIDDGAVYNRRDRSTDKNAGLSEVCDLRSLSLWRFVRTCRKHQHHLQESKGPGLEEGGRTRAISNTGVQGRNRGIVV
jgi:hypothetical protein